MQDLFFVGVGESESESECVAESESESECVAQSERESMFGGCDSSIKTYDSGENCGASSGYV